MSKKSESLEVGKKLVELCRQGKNLDAVDTLYSDKIVSIEAASSPTVPSRLEGIDAIRAKNDWFLQNHEIHSGEVFGPYPHGDRFVVHMRMDVTPRVGSKAGERMQLDEAALYTVQDGKIVQEEFFYAM